MSLQVWLPLNGDLHNQGLNNIQPIGNGITLDNNGKIGKCYSFNGSNSISINKVVLPSQTPNWSFACWFLFTDTTVTSANCFFSERTGTTSTGYSIFIYPSTGRILVDDGVRWNFISSMTFTQNVWYHLVITRSPLGKKLYINGELKDSTSTVGNTSTINTNGCLIGLAQTSTALTTGNQGLIGKLNDVRIYNHCLSQKEVEEISKGLVLHYKLDQPANINYNLYTGSKDFSGTWVNGSAWTTDTDTYNGFIVKKKSSIWGGLAQNITATNGDIFTISFWAKVDSGGNILSIHRSSLGNVTTGLTVLDGNFSSGTNWVNASENGTQWKRYWATLEINSTDITYLQWRIENSVANKNLYVAGMTLEKGYGTKNWSLSASEAGTTNIIYDCSGYGNNGTIINSLTINNDTARYNLSLQFNGSNTAIVAGRGAMVKDEISVCCWAQMDTWSSYNGRLLSCTEGGGWNFEPNSGKMNFACGTGTSSNTYKSAVSTTTLTNLGNKWHFFVGTYNGLQTKIYIDGILENTNNAYSTKTPLYYHTSNGIFIGAEAASNATTPTGSYFNGKISDVRIYATALTADQIKELYNVSATIDNEGNGYAREEIEDSSLNITKTGQFHNGELLDSNDYTTASIVKTNKQLKVNNFYEY